MFTQLSQPQSLRTSGTQGRKEAKCLLGVVSREATLLESESAEENQEALGGDESVEMDQVQFSRSVMSDFVTPWTAARQASLSITNSWS